MKKLISKLTLVAFALAMVPTANAAGVVLSGSSIAAGRDVITIDLPAGVDLETADTATIRITNTATGAAVDMDTTTTVTDITFDGDATNDDTFGETAAYDYDNGYVVVTVGPVDDPADGSDLIISLGSALATDTAYTVSYRDSDGNYGAFMVNTGTSNQVVVTATVEPTLNMVVTNTAIDLGILNPASQTDSGTDTNVAVRTNSVSGYIIQASATDFTGANTANVIPFVTEAAQAAGTEGFSVDATVNTQISAGTGIGTLAIDAGFAAGTGNVAIGNAAKTIAAATGTAGDGSIDVNYAGNIATNTEADAYSTTVTYVTTANF